MSYNAATLFDDASPNGDEFLLLDDLVTLVALGLLEERPTPNGPVYALTEFSANAASRREFGEPVSAYACDAMCRNIRQLHNFEPPATHDEIHASALQYVRKISGSTKPSQANQAAFDRAVEEVVAATTRLLDHLVTNAPPKNREEEAAKAKARAAQRYAA